jgi:hypothetical protein
MWGPGFWNNFFFGLVSLVSPPSPNFDFLDEEMIVLFSKLKHRINMMALMFSNLGPETKPHAQNFGIRGPEGTVYANYK